MKVPTEALRLAHGRAVSGDGQAIIDALLGDGVSPDLAAWVSTWWLAVEEESVVAARGLAYCIARVSRNGIRSSVVEACRLWLLEDGAASTDPSTAITLCTGLEFCVAETECPREVRSSVAQFLRRAASSVDLNVVSSARDLLRTLSDAGALEMVLNRPAADDLVARFGTRAAEGTLQETELDLGFLAEAKLPSFAPHNERALLRTAMDLEEQLEPLMLEDTARLTGNLRRRALLDEALAQAAISGSPVQTLRLLRDDPSMGFVRSVISFSEAVVRATRSPDTSEDDWREFGIHFRPALAASYPLHLTFQEEDARAVFDALSRILRATASESELKKVLSETPSPIVEASHRLLTALVNSGATLEVAISEPQAALWQTTARGSIDRLSGTVLRRIAKKLRQESRGRRVWLDRSDVPQANSIRVVLEVVLLVITNGIVSEDDVATLNSHRQINYYRHAARVLYLLDEDNMPTPRAHALAGLPEKEQLRLIAVYFEDSIVGRAWREWAGVSRLSEIDVESASQFLLESVVGLSGSTPGRRATTLTKWLEDLSPYLH